MLSSEIYVAYELKRLREKKERYEEMLSELPEGKLNLCASKGIPYYMKTCNGKKEYLGNDAHEEVQKLKKRKFLEVSIGNMNSNQTLIEQYLHEYRSMQPREIMKSLPKAYQSEVLRLEDEVDSIKAWEFDEYKKSTNHPERLIYSTRKGDFVRSKSEAVIADILYDREIPYHYEEKLQLGDRIVVPDFKILVYSEARFKYLDHCGSLGTERYSQNFAWKVQCYLSHGYLPWRDVFFTFNDMKGRLDTIAINEMLDHYFV